MAKPYRKKVKPGAIILDPVEPVLAVQLETFVLDNNQLGKNVKATAVICRSRPTIR